MEDKKSTWTRPQLVVLGRGRPEENILVACKGKGGPGTPQGPDGFTACRTDGGPACRVDADT